MDIFIEFYGHFIFYICIFYLKIFSDLDEGESNASFVTSWSIFVHKIKTLDDNVLLIAPFLLLHLPFFMQQHQNYQLSLGM